MLDEIPEKGHEIDQTTRPIKAVTRSRPKVRKRRLVGAGTRGRLLVYGLPVVAFILIMTVFVVKIASVQPVQLPFQELDSFQQADVLIDRGDQELIDPPTITSLPSQNTQTSASITTEPSSDLPQTEPSSSEIDSSPEDMPEASVVVIKRGSIAFVIKKSADVYAFPNEESEVLATVATNNALVKLGEANGWTSVRTSQRMEGYVKSDFLGDSPVFVPKTGATYYLQNYQCNIRVGPGTQYETEGFGLRGMTLTVLDAGDEWSKIRTENGVSGYMLNDLFGPDQPANEVNELDRGRYMYIDTEVANLRDAPSVDSELIGAAFMDDRVYQISDNGGWSKVKTEGGIIAYVHDNLLRTTPPANPFQKTNKTYYVATGSANVRSSPTTDSAVLDRVSFDGKVLELEANDAWSKVKLDNGTIGFISSDLLTSVVPPPAGFQRTTGKVYVITSAANVRSQPNTNCTIVTVARHGNQLTRKATGAEWSMIETSSGQTGYISNDLISTNKPAPPPTPSSGSSTSGGTTNSGGTTSGGTSSGGGTTSGGTTSGGTTSGGTTSGGGDKNADSRKRIVEIAKSFLGVRYQLGGKTINAVDCSGLVKYCYEAMGYKNIPHGSDPQARQLGTRVAFAGRDFSNLLPGDLVFFSRGYGYHHVGIYIGNNKMIHAARGSGVVIVDLMNYYSTPARVNRVLN